MTTTTVEAKFTAGSALSEGIDCSAGDVVRFEVPAEIPSGWLTLQISSDGVYYNDLHNSRGLEWACKVRSETAMSVGGDWTHHEFLKLRAGTREAPTPVSVDCSVRVVLEIAGTGSARSAAPSPAAAPVRKRA